MATKEDKIVDEVCKKLDRKPKEDVWRYYRCRYCGIAYITPSSRTRHEAEHIQAQDKRSHR